jgi:hypothetical protein
MSADGLSVSASNPLNNISPILGGADEAAALHWGADDFAPSAAGRAVDLGREGVRDRPRAAANAGAPNADTRSSGTIPDTISTGAQSKPAPPSGRTTANSAVQPAQSQNAKAKDPFVESINHQYKEALSKAPAGNDPWERIQYANGVASFFDGVVDAHEKANHELGSLSAKYESGGKGDPGRVSSGVNDPGGVSYGTYQMSTTKGIADNFANSNDAAPWRSDFTGPDGKLLKAGTPAFTKAWQDIASREPAKFGQAQQTYIHRNYYEEQVSRVKKGTGYDLDSAPNAIRDAALSTSVQHGQYTRILTDAVKATQSASQSNPSLDFEKTLLDNIYAGRVQSFTKSMNAKIAQAKAATASGDIAKANELLGKAQTDGNVLKGRLQTEPKEAQKSLSEERERAQAYDFNRPARLGLDPARIIEPELKNLGFRKD